MRKGKRRQLTAEAPGRTGDNDEPSFFMNIILKEPQKPSNPLHFLCK